MKNTKDILLFILSFIWQLPQNIVAIVILPFLGKLRLISYKKLCFAFEGSNMAGGISLGNFAFLDHYLANNEASVAHEQEGHTWDSQRFGPLYLFVIGIPSLFHAAFSKCPCYYDFYTERWANKHANLEVIYTTTGRCYLKKK